MVLSNERVGKFFISVRKRTKKVEHTHFKTRRLYVNGVPLVKRMYTKEKPFLSRMIYKKRKWLDLGAEPPRIKRYWVAPGEEEG